jgi:hypothetical protein
MATYKVLQDIEAEDKLVGPLTLRQFIYAIVMMVCLYICFILVTKGAPFLTVIFLPPAFISGFFAFPFGREQPTEIWALAKIRFMIKPRRRIWDQSGVKELVTVTAPKRVEMIYTNGLSETEVAGRLKALADTIDSRGWAIKNINPGMQMQATAGGTNAAGSDRLIGVNVLPQVQPTADVQPADDMLDEQNNPVARQFDQMLEKSDVDHRERIKLEMSQATASRQTPAPAPSVQAAAPASPQNDYWFLNQAPTTGPAQVVTPNEPVSAVPATVAAAEPTADEKALAKQFKEQNKDSMQISYGHMRTIQPLSARPKPATQPPSTVTAAGQPPANTVPSSQSATATKPGNAPVTRQPNPDTLRYVNNDDLTVATIARQVNENPPDEVVISLH